VGSRGPVHGSHHEQEQEAADIARATQLSLEEHAVALAHQAQLDHYAASRGLRSLDAYVRNQGDCGFDSLELIDHGPGGDWLSTRQQRSGALRARLVAYLRASENTLLPGDTHFPYSLLPRRGDFPHETFSEYLDAMSAPGVYLEGPIMYAAAVVLQRPIRVVMSSLTHQPRVLEFDPESDFQDRPPILLALRNTPNGQHFYPLCPCPYPLVHSIDRC
jgi:hypothetical protein